MYFDFFFCVVALLFISYWIFDKDIMHPAVFLYLFSAGAALFAFYLFNYWKLYDFGGMTTWLLVLGLSSFAVGSLFAKLNRCQYVTGRQKKANSCLERSGRIFPNKIVVLLVIVLSLTTLIIFLMYYRTRITSSSVLSNVLEYKNSRDENDLPGYINVALKTVCAFSHCFMYIFMHNRIRRQGRHKDFWLLIPVVIYCLISLLMANRGNILMIALSCLSAWYILYQRHIGWKKRITSIFLKKSFRIAVTVFVLFWLFKVVTRNTVLLDMSSAFDNFMTYICCYYSGGISAFDMYLKQGGTACKWWGQETFVALNNNLNTLFGTGNASTRFLEFRSGFGYSVVNIYTSFRRFYHDFGSLGIWALSFIQGYVTSRLYYLVKRKRDCKDIDFLMVVYCFFFYTVPYTMIEEFFYSSNVSISGLVKLAILAVAYFVTFYHSKREPT